jgi:predicted RNA-binding protein associated with RNAse of E/G family
LKGWYCNIVRPARLEPEHIWSVDLALDLVVLPDGRWVVVDQEEFRKLELPEWDCLNALAALRQLGRLARAQQAPFNSRQGPLSL